MSEPKYFEETVVNYTIKDDDGVYHKYGENARRASTHFIQIFNKQSEDYIIVQEKKLDEQKRYEGYFAVDKVTFKILHPYSAGLSRVIETIKELREDDENTN